MVRRIKSSVSKRTLPSPERHPRKMDFWAKGSQDGATCQRNFTASTVTWIVLSEWFEFINISIYHLKWEMAFWKSKVFWNVRIFVKAIWISSNIPISCENCFLWNFGQAIRSRSTLPFWNSYSNKVSTHSKKFVTIIQFTNHTIMVLNFSILLVPTWPRMRMYKMFFFLIYAHLELPRH